MSNYEPIELFARPFDPSDGNLSDEEKLKASKDFAQLIDDVFLANIENLSVIEDGASLSHIEVKNLTPEGRYISHLDILVSANKYNEKKIQLREFQKQQQPKTRTTQYVLELGADEVRRIDEYDYPNLGAEKDSHDSEILEDSGGFAQLVESAENYSLEVDLGYNNQPINAEEVYKLRKLIIG